MIYKYCRRCGKRLKDEESRVRGFGKTCLARARAENPKAVLVPVQLTLFEELDEVQSKAGRGKAKAEGRARQGKQNSKALEKKEKEQGKGQGVRPSLLEKTLTPTYKKPLLFTPHTLTPAPICEDHPGRR